MANFFNGIGKGIKSGLKESFDFSNLGQSIGEGLVGAAGSAAGGLVGGLIGGGYESGAGSTLNTIGDFASMIPGVGGILGGGAKILGGVTNALFGTKVNEEALRAANAGTAAYNNFTSNATSFDAIQGPISQANVQNVYKNGLFASGAGAKNAALRQERIDARQRAFRAVENNINNLVNDQMNNSLAGYFAFGGAIPSNGANWSNGIMGIKRKSNNYAVGEVYDVDEAEYNRLKRLGYGIKRI